MGDVNSYQPFSILLNKLPSDGESLEMKKLMKYNVSRKKLPRLKLRRKVKSPLRSSCKMKVEESCVTNESEKDLVPKINKIHEDGRTNEETTSTAEFRKIELAKEKAIIEASRLQVAAKLAYVEVDRLSKEIQELEGSRLQAIVGVAHTEVDRLVQDIKVSENVQVQHLIAIPRPSHSSNKRWNSEILNVRINNKKLNPEDFVIDVEDKGDEIDIKLRIK